MSKVNIPKNNNLTMFVPSFIDDYGFTAAEFRVFARIMRRSTGEHSAGHYESIPTMSKTLGISERLVREAIQVLKGCGAIQVMQREGTTQLIIANTCDKWSPKVQLVSVRENIVGVRVNKDRERKLTPSGNATGSGNATPPPSGNATQRYSH